MTENPAPANPRNQLRHATSPYLQQHRDNPVDWRLWGDAALAEAKDLNRPILLSIGYAACHWCHVMAHESFENPAIAALMNRHFINIKIDREERPDLDLIYQQALALLGQRGGWPLTMFLTPSGQPFWGGTYFPPEDRYGRPGFARILTTLADTWTDDRDRVEANVAAIAKGLEKLGQPAGGTAIPPGLSSEIATRLLGEIDPVHGGLAQAPKFPQVPLLTLLWQHYRRSGDQAFRQAVTNTLDHMAQGGIYDHLGGGFARYSVDAEWLVPHFEKMLYDNAELIGLMSRVWQESRSPLLAARVAETIGWLQREMTVQDAAGNKAFAASLDADSENVEGKFYVWDEADIDRLLGSEADFFKRHYDVTAAGNWEGKTILNRSARPGLLDEAGEERLRAARALLIVSRETRVRPGLDDKVLTDWNGLMIAALAQAALTFRRPDWLVLAKSAFAFIRQNLFRDGRLFHGWHHGRTGHVGMLDDHAMLAQAAIALHLADGDPASLTVAEELVAALDRDFLDPEQGGYYLTARDQQDVILRPRTAGDNATPSGNGVMLGVLARLHVLTGRDSYRDRAEQLIRAFAGEIHRNFFPLMSFITNADLLAGMIDLTIIGDPASPDTAALADCAGALADARIQMRIVAPGISLPETHPAAGKQMIDGRATAYICRDRQCDLPVTDADPLKENLERMLEQNS